MSPVGAAADLSAGCRVTLEGATMDPSIADRILEVRVDTTVGLPDVCTIRFAEVEPDSSGSLTVIDDKRLALGKALSVKFAEPAGGQLRAAFDGEITTLEAELGAAAAGEPVMELTVTAHDRSHRMHRVTTTRTFRQMTVSDIARKMAGAHGLKVGTLATLGGGAPEERHQVGETDWEYLSRLVRGHAGELDVSAGALNIVDPAKRKAPAAELFYGETLRRFRPRMSSVGQVAEVTVSGWDQTKKQAIVKTAKPKASTTVEKSDIDGAVSATKVLLVSSPVSSDAEADAQAKAAALQLGHERVQGTAVASGDPRLLAGEFVHIDGVGKRFAGTYRIVSAVHTYGSRGYTTQLTLGAGGRPLAETLGSGGRSRGFADHLAIAVVTDNKDPQSLGRVKVRYPLLNDEVESGWARIAWGAAGAARGTVALPHVGDEVAVGFEHGDVRRPVILGTLFNGRDKPGADLVKAATSLAARYPRDLDVASDTKTLFASKQGITVKSAEGPFELEAAKAIKLTATQGPLTIETTGQIKAKGDQGVEITATGPLKITSKAPVTVESSAVLQLKGSAIQVQASGVLQLSGATVMLG